MGAVAYETPFPDTQPMGKRWDPTHPLPPPPAAQFERVQRAWQAPSLGQSAAADFTDYWSRLPAFSWLHKDGGGGTVLKGVFPERLAKVLKAEYTEAPMVGDV